MRRPPANIRVSGFTLVELLLAITLMSMLLGLAYGGLRAATRASERGQVLLEASEGIRSAHQFVRRQLNQMVPLAYAEEGELGDTRIIFEGSARHVQFVAPMPGYLGRGGPQVQRIEIGPGAEGLSLLFSHALWQDFDQARLYDREPVALLEGFEFAEFQFRGRDEEGELTPWSSSWEDVEALPVAVRLVLDAHADRQAIWPELTTIVRVDPESVRVRGGTSSYSEAIDEMIRGGRRGPDS